jgi:hypothetical protein
MDNHILINDLKESGKLMSKAQARFLVDSYYIWQEKRKRESNQVRSLSKEGEPIDILAWQVANSRLYEETVKKILDKYSSAHHMGRWARQIIGIGPVISAGLLAHIDIENAKTAGAVWKFAGLDPTSKWEKGKKRPWNARLKVLAWKIGQSFIKTCNNPKSFYGPIYLDRKEYEKKRNEAGELANQAKEGLKRVRPKTIAYTWYKKGLLPPGHIDQRASRYAAKLFLAHYWEELFQYTYNKKPPAPYPIAFVRGHTHIIERPK